jgi:hypothetical protein
MKTKESIKLTTVGKLLEELTGFEKISDDCVGVWIPDGSTLCIVGMGLDKDGDLRIELEEQLGEQEGFWSAADTIEALKEYGKDVRVYFAGCGLYLSIDPVHDGSIFKENDDDDLVGCYASAFGEYRPEPQRDGYEERLSAETAMKKNRRDCIETLVLILIMLAAICLFGYNIYALIAGIGGPLWEKILWIVGSGIVLVVSSFTLYYSKK